MQTYHELIFAILGSICIASGFLMIALLGDMHDERIAHRKHKLLEKLFVAMSQTQKRSKA